MSLQTFAYSSSLDHHDHACHHRISIIVDLLFELNIHMHTRNISE